MSTEAAASYECMTQSRFEQPLASEAQARAAAGYDHDGRAVVGKHRVYPELAAAGVWTTVVDLAGCVIGIQKVLAGQPGPLKHETAENMLSPRLAGYALGWGTEERGSGDYFVHWGANAGFLGAVVAHGRGGYGAAILTNSGAGDGFIRELLGAIGAEGGWEGYGGDP